MCYIPRLRITYLYHDLDPNLDCNLDRNPEDVPIYTKQSLCSIQSTKRITLLFIVSSQSTNIWIKMIQIVIQIKCSHGIRFIDPDCDLDYDPDHFPLCKQVNRMMLISNLFTQIKIIWIAFWILIWILIQTFIVQFYKACHVCINCLVIV